VHEPEPARGISRAEIEPGSIVLDPQRPTAFSIGCETNLQLTVVAIAERVFGSVEHQFREYQAKVVTERSIDL
jgi:hypothetical protein